MKLFDFVNRANADYIDRLYEQYQRDPRSLDEEWAAFFAGFEVGNARSAAASSDAGKETGDKALSMGIFDLVHSYRELGHFVAKLDPLGHNRANHPLLELSQFGMS